MDFTIDQLSLSHALRLVGHAVPARASPSILQAVLLEVEPGRLNLSVTDSDLTLTTVVAAEVAKPGQAAIPARLLVDYVSRLPAETIHLTLNQARQRVRATCGRFRVDLAVLDSEGFPRIPSADEKQALGFAAPALRRAIERVTFAATSDEGRPILAAVLFDFGESGLTLAAADGFRLARARLPEVIASPRQLLVPARAVSEFGRLLAEGQSAHVVPTPDDRAVHLVVGPTTLYSRLVEGRFPDVERVIPRSWDTRVEIDAASFRQAVRLASLFGDRSETRPVILEVEPGLLRLRARGDEAGEAESELQATLEGEPRTIALNTSLLNDILDAVDSKQLELAWTSPQMPFVVREAGQANTGDLWLAMPVHLPAVTRALVKAA